HSESVPHCASVLAVQSASQEPWQLKEPGSALHSALQEPLQSAVQLASMEALHCPSQAATKLSGVHLALQPPSNSRWHSPKARASRLPHAAAPLDCAKADDPNEKRASALAAARHDARRDMKVLL